MRPADNIHELIRNTKIKTNPEVNEAVLNDLLGQMDHAEGVHINAPRQNIWRIIMKSRMTKLATAAVILLIALLGVTFLGKTATPAWAIEQSIEAMKNYRGIHYSGVIAISWEDYFEELGVKNLPEVPDGKGEFEMWAQANEDLSRSLSIKMICPDSFIASGNILHSYLQLSDGITYDIQGDFLKIDPWPTSKLLRILKDSTDTWTELYGMHAETGKEHIFVKCSSRAANKSWTLEFDLETKLLISLKQWNNSDNHESVPTIDVSKIVYYERLPDEIFEINLPDSTEIIAVNMPLYDPDFGINAEGLTQEQACHKILEEFWRAVNEKNFDIIRKLVPYTAGWNDKAIINGFGGDLKLIELIEMGQIYQDQIGPVVPCTIKTKDKDVIVDIIVLFREINGKSSCVIHSNKGQSRPVE